MKLDYKKLYHDNRFEEGFSPDSSGYPAWIGVLRRLGFEVVS